MKKLKISIVIVTFNSGATVKHTIKSVLNQSYKKWEIVIIDNKSSDNTLRIIRSFKNDKIRIFCSKDKGIYDAINKGIVLSTGDIISILHSDDFYNHKNVLTNIAKNFSNSMISIVYGNIFYIKKNNQNKICRAWIGKKYIKNDFLSGLSPPHPSFFVRKKTYLTYGLYKLNIGNSADIELMYRYLVKYNLRNIYVNNFFVKMQIGGASNKNVGNIFNQNKETIKFLKIKRNPIKVIHFFIYKFLDRVNQIMIARYYT